MRTTHRLLGTLIVIAMTKTAIAQTGAPSAVTDVRRTDTKIAGPPTCSLTASSTTLPAGGTTPSTLTWSTGNAARVTLNRGTVAASGTMTVRPLADATYTLTAYGASGTTPAVCQQVIRVTQPACANGTICAVSCGTGMIPDIRTGALIALPNDRLVHVLLLAEGYTTADLPRFQTDVNNWMAQWGALDVYDTFREAFCFWKLPAVSNQRIVPGGIVEDTAFRVPVDASGDVDFDDPLLTDAVEQRIWAQIPNLPFPPTTFYPTSGSRTRGMAKTLVVATMLYEAAMGASGYEGKTALLENPGNAGQTVAAAFAHNRPHEFTHAFSRARDEYITLDGDPQCVPNGGSWTSANVSNVVCGSACSSLPWKHLVLGGEANPSGPGGLVGAFGHADEGYHSELKCLMNGNRTDNATVFGGETNLRDTGRMCNFCRELTVFRLLERIGELSSTSTSYATWTGSYRQPFYATYGMDIPSTIPMETPPGRPVFNACTP